MTSFTPGIPYEEADTGTSWADALFHKLCSVCETLDLSISKFVIGTVEAVTTRRGSSTPGGNTATSSQRERSHLTSGSALRCLATYAEIQQRRLGCRFCDLAYRAIERYGNGNVDDTVPLSVAWEVDGRQVLSGGRLGGMPKRAVNRTRRMRLSWRETGGAEESVYLLFLAPGGVQSIQTSSIDYEQRSSRQSVGEREEERDETQALIKGWVDLCTMKHGLSCQKPHGTSTEFMQLIKGTYFGVIDVIDMRLMELPVIRGTPSRYVALSYVWGENEGLDKPHYKTTRANVMKHIQSQGLKKAWNLLPKTIRDVILLVNRLGERYLWIDSLCIVQDSASSWELNAKSMHLVYGNAYFTVCAADGDAETGLLAADVSTWMDSTTTTIDGTSSFTPSTKARTSSLSAEVAPGVRIIASRPAEAVIQGSRWSQRGWTFQERMLSRRCLIFIEGQVYFQCRSSLISQHIFPDHGGSSNDKNWSLEWTNSPLRTLEGLKRKAFWFYMKCVSLYTGRHLTKPQDVLAAFSGISWLLKQQMQAALFYGLPMSHFDLALLWTPIEPLERRRHVARGNQGQQAA